MFIKKNRTNPQYKQLAYLLSGLPALKKPSQNEGLYKRFYFSFKL